MHKTPASVLSLDNDLLELLELWLWFDRSTATALQNLIGGCQMNGWVNKASYLSMEVSASLTLTKS